MYNYYAREFFLSVTVSQMDGDHFVSVSVIAGFSKVHCTCKLQLCAIVHNVHCTCTHAVVKCAAVCSVLVLVTCSTHMQVKRLTTDINLIMDAIRGTIQMYMYMSCFYQLTHTFIHKHTLTFIHKHIHTYNVHTYTLPRP
jgi:hypothetical protein